MTAVGGQPEHGIDRLRTPRDFRRVYDEGRRHVADLFVLYRRPLPGPARVGISVGRRVGTAVVRNRVRRRVREILRHIPLGRCQEVVVVVRPQAARADFAALRSQLEALVRESGALRAPSEGRGRAEGDDGRSGGS
ncbi:MAG: ribonuclease P protein component [Armatimonadota bacterium]|nr:ribonuclease P protein component [Armatimonadota bacterium]MDR5696744.1 ribonuclease P protein component [Armatimonadota bacterium]